jgi:hypothetical protein
MRSVNPKNTRSPNSSASELLGNDTGMWLTRKTAIDTQQPTVIHRSRPAPSRRVIAQPAPGTQVNAVAVANRWMCPESEVPPSGPVGKGSVGKATATTTAADDSPSRAGPVRPVGSRDSPTATAAAAAASASRLSAYGTAPCSLSA